MLEVKLALWESMRYLPERRGTLDRESTLNKQINKQKSTVLFQLLALQTTEIFEAHGLPFTGCAFWVPLYLLLQNALRVV